MLKRTLWIRDQSARYMLSFLGLRPMQKPTFNYVYAIHKNILSNSHSIYMSFQIFLHFGPVASSMLNKLFEFEFEKFENIFLFVSQVRRDNV